MQTDLDKERHCMTYDMTWHDTEASSWVFKATFPVEKIFFLSLFFSIFFLFLWLYASQRFFFLFPFFFLFFFDFMRRKDFFSFFSLFLFFSFWLFSFISLNTRAHNPPGFLDELTCKRKWQEKIYKKKKKERKKKNISSFLSSDISGFFPRHWKRDFLWREIIALILCPLLRLLFVNEKLFFS